MAERNVNILSVYFCLFLHNIVSFICENIWHKWEVYKATRMLIWMMTLLYVRKTDEKQTRSLTYNIGIKQTPKRDQRARWNFIKQSEIESRTFESLKF